MFEEWYVTRRWSNAARYYTLRFFHEPHLLLQPVTVPEHVPHGSQIMLRGRVIAPHRIVLLGPYLSLIWEARGVLIDSRHRKFLIDADPIRNI
jgi:hypothetical protein